MSLEKKSEAMTNEDIMNIINLAVNKLTNEMEIRRLEVEECNLNGSNAGVGHSFYPVMGKRFFWRL